MNYSHGSAEPIRKLAYILIYSFISILAFGSSQDALSGQSETACSFEEICPNNGLEKLWAQKRIDADLMNVYIESHKLRAPRVRTPVAVLDTGFDATRLNDLYNPDSTKMLVGEFEERLRNSIDPQVDTVGHGTMVTSTIGGKAGLGVSPRAEISIYKITSDDSGSVPLGATMKNIQKACKDAKQADPRSTPVINLSWGARSDEMGLERNEERVKKLLHYLGKEGCLLVKSAGNDHFIRHDAAVNGLRLDDPYLRVGSSTEFGQRASFSSSGEVQAPGTGVYVIASLATSDAERPDPDDACEKVPSEEISTHVSKAVFINGTSFSSPLVAGIAAEVIGVLRSTSRFDDLAGETRVALVNRILKASTLVNSVNGLRAVIIANAWAKNSLKLPQQLPSVGMLRKLLELERSAICVEPFPAIKTDQCGTEEGVVSWDKARFQAAVCKVSHESIQTMVETSIEMNQLQSAFKYRSALASVAAEYVPTGLAIQILQRALQEPGKRTARTDNLLWTKGSALEISPATLSALLPDVISEIQFEQSTARKRSLVTNALDLFEAHLSSQSLQSELDQGPGRGSEGVLAAIMHGLAKLQSVAGAASFKAMLSRSLKSILEPGSTTWSKRQLVTAIRLVTAMREDKHFSPIWTELLEFDQTIYDAMTRVNDQGSPVSQKDEEFVFLFEAKATGSYFSKFLDRMKDTLIRDLEAHRWHFLSSEKLNYAVQNVDALIASPELKSDFMIFAPVTLVGIRGVIGLEEMELLRAAWADPKTLGFKNQDTMANRLTQLAAESSDHYFLRGLVIASEPPLFFDSEHERAYEGIARAVKRSDGEKVKLAVRALEIASEKEIYGDERAALFRNMLKDFLDAFQKKKIQFPPEFVADRLEAFLFRVEAGTVSAAKLEAFIDFLNDQNIVNILRRSKKIIPVLKKAGNHLTKIISTYDSSARLIKAIEQSQ